MKWLSLILTAFLIAKTASVQAETLVHSETSLYNNIYIFDDAGIRCMRFAIKGQGPQSCMRPDFPNEMVFDYTRLMLTALYLKPQPRSVLLIGLGGGTLPTVLGKLYPDIEMDIAEIDPAIPRLAEKFFSFKPTPKQRVVVEDGRVFVRRAMQNKKQYDIVMLDAYKGEVIPEHMTTREFLQEVKTILTPGGLLSANTNLNIGIYDHESTTYESVFGKFLALKSGANRIIIAGKDKTPGMDAVIGNADLMDERVRPFGLDFFWILPFVSVERDWDPSARIFTDQYGPANLLKGVPSRPSKE